MRKNIVLILSILFCLGSANIASAIVLYHSQSELVNMSQNIIHGFVTDKWAREGRNPVTIETMVEIYVAESIKGQAPQKIVLTLPGGSIGDNFMFVTDQPNFEIGQEVVVFLEKDMTRVAGLIQGKLTIENGMVLEMMIGADGYLQSLNNMAAGLEPVIDMDATFAPVSMIDAYVNSLVVPAFSYSGLHWPKNLITIYINANTDDTKNEDDAVKLGMQAWTNVKADFTFKYGSTHNRNYPDFNGLNEVHWTEVDDYGSAIAFASIWGNNNIIAECDMTMLDKYKWSADDYPKSDEMDVQAIATHEFGHFLCLNDLYDNSDYDKTMYGYGGPGDIGARSLHQDDKDGIIHIYGPGPGVDDVPEPPSNKDEGLSASKCEEIIESIYYDCDYTVLDGSGDSISEALAEDECNYGSSSTSWTCIDGCYEDTDYCEDFFKCANQNCDSVFSSSSGFWDDDGGGGCGF